MGDSQNILEGSLCYLIGAIDCASDLGVGWRKKTISECKNNNLDIKFLDPTHKVVGLLSETREEHKKIMSLKDNSQWDELSQLMRVIVRQDHRSVDLSDFVIFHVDSTVHHCGSYFEFQSALTQKKPYFIISEGGKKTLPSWMFGICDHNFVFDRVEDVIQYLVGLNNGSIPLSSRWVLFRKQISRM